MEGIGDHESINGLAPTRITSSLSCFAWNKDQSKIAICPNTMQIWIFNTNNAPDDSTKWERIQVSKLHENLVCSLDWNIKSDLLLTASVDHNIIIWKEDVNIKGLKPQSVIINEPKSIIDASWNTNGNKFCVGTTSGNVFIGNYNEDFNGFEISDSITG